MKYKKFIRMQCRRIGLWVGHIVVFSLLKEQSALFLPYVVIPAYYFSRFISDNVTFIKELKHEVPKTRVMFQENKKYQYVLERKDYFIGKWITQEEFKTMDEALESQVSLKEQWSKSEKPLLIYQD